jgi:hypothetical protein
MLYVAFLIMWTVFAVSALPTEGDVASVLLGRTVMDMVIVMSGFGALIVALMMVLSTLHKRNLASLIGPRWTATVQGWRVVKLCALLFALIFLLPEPTDMQPTQVMSFGGWLALLPLSLVLLAIQCGAEELVFRGYLQSQLAAQSKSPLVWIGVPSVVFGLLHYSPEFYGEAAWWVVIWSAIFGAMMADITARAGTLGPAIAIHMLNNFMAMCLVGYKDDLGGLALYHVPYRSSDADVVIASLPFELGVMLCLWLTARIALRR